MQGFSSKGFFRGTGLCNRGLSPPTHKGRQALVSGASGKVCAALGTGSRVRLWSCCSSHLTHGAGRGWWCRLSTATLGPQGRGGPCSRGFTLQGQNRQCAKSRWHRRLRTRRWETGQRGLCRLRKGRRSARGYQSQAWSAAAGQGRATEGTAGQTGEDALPGAGARPLHTYPPCQSRPWLAPWAPGPQGPCFLQPTGPTTVPPGRLTARLVHVAVGPM